MKLELQGKAAMVTAASEGLGYACAHRLAEEGCRLVISGRREAALEAAAQVIREAAGGEAWAVPGDLSSLKDIERLVSEGFERLGRLDILVVNSGHVPYGGLEELTEEDWYEAFHLLLLSYIRLTRLIVPRMRSQGAGDIVFITSSVVREPSATLLLSSVFRVGVVALARSLSRTLAGDNIRVNVVAPGYFDSGRVRRRMMELVDREGLSREAAVQRVAGEIPQRRVGEPTELADLVTFLVSRRSRFLTGAVIQIDGGKARGLL